MYKYVSIVILSNQGEVKENCDLNNQLSLMLLDQILATCQLQVYGENAFSHFAMGPRIGSMILKGNCGTNLSGQSIKSSFF